MLSNPWRSSAERACMTWMMSAGSAGSSSSGRPSRKQRYLANSTTARSSAVNSVRPCWRALRAKRYWPIIPGGHLVDLRHRHAVDWLCPICGPFVGFLQRVVADHRVHQPDHGGGLEAGAVTVQRTGQGGDGEETGRLVDPTGCPLARECAGQGHRQRGVGIGEGRDEGSARNEGGQQRRGDAFLPSAFAYQVEVDPLRGGLHGGDERHELGGRVGYGLDALAAGRLEHVDQLRDAVRGHQCRIGIGDDVAEHGGRADQFRDAIVFQDRRAVGDPGGQGRVDVGLGGQPIRLPVEVEVSVEVGLQIALAADSLREFGVVRDHHCLPLTNS